MAVPTPAPSRYFQAYDRRKALGTSEYVRHILYFEVLLSERDFKLDGRFSRGGNVTNIAVSSTTYQPKTKASSSKYHFEGIFRNFHVVFWLIPPKLIASNSRTLFMNQV